MASNSLTISFLTGFVLLPLISQVKAHTLANHGETCNSTKPCNSRAFLTCNNETCECIMSDTMSFDGNKCTVLAGEKCTYTNINIDDDKTALTEELPCVINSACETGFCTCLPDFYEVGNGTCLKKRNFEQPCELDIECKLDMDMVCGADKVCRCNTTNTIFDIHKETCAKLAGVSCKPEETKTKPCQQKAKCWDDLCTCRRAYFANSNGICVKRLGLNSSCVDSSYCKQGLVCNRDKRCDCNSSLSIYDEEKTDCVQLAGATFILESQFENSVANSRCSSSSYSSHDNVGDYYSYTSKSCVCQPNYYQTSEGFCKPKGVIGTPCPSSSNEEICSYDLNGIKCGSSGFCECYRLLKVYDPAKRRCVALVGSPCKDTHFCVTNSKCSSVNLQEKECICTETYLQSPSDTCLVPHGGYCGEWTNQCNNHQGLVCVYGLCECKYGDMQQFDTKKRKCVSLVHGPCDENILCVANSHCNKNMGKCVCNEGFIEVDRVCQITIGQPCPHPDDDVECDSYAKLKCIDGTCQCGPWEHYDVQLGICRGLVDSICDVSNGGYCTPNAVCARARSKRENRGICKCLDGWLASVDGRCVISQEIGNIWG